MTDPRLGPRYHQVIDRSNIDLSILTPQEFLPSRLRGRANRLWFAGGSALPAVANPALSDEPPNHYDHVRERDPEVYDPILPLGTPHQFLVGVVPGVRPLHHPAQTGRQRSGHALLGYHAHQAPIFEELAGLLRVVGPIEVDAGMLGQLDRRLPVGGVQSGRKKRRIVTISSRRDHCQGYAVRVHHRRAFDAPFAAIHRACARLRPSAWSLRYAPVDRHVEKLQADEAVVCSQGDLLQSVHQTGLHPLVTPAPYSGSRTRLVGYAPVGAAEDEDLYELLEDHPIGDAGSVAAERVVGFPLGQQVLELRPDGLDEVRFECGHGDAPSNGEASATPRMIEDPCPLYTRACSLLARPLSTTVVNSKALWHHALFDDIGGDDAKNGGPEDG